MHITVCLGICSLKCNNMPWLKCTSGLIGLDAIVAKTLFRSSCWILVFPSELSVPSGYNKRDHICNEIDNDEIRRIAKFLMRIKQHLHSKSYQIWLQYACIYKVDVTNCKECLTLSTWQNKHLENECEAYIGRRSLNINTF